MLLTKEVEVNVCTGAKYYEAKGYKIPKYYNENNSRNMIKRGTTIKVLVQDLKSCSVYKIQYECDCCHEIKEVAFNTFYRNHKNLNELTYCHKCALKIKNSGENNPNWNPNKTQEDREHERSTTEYHEFTLKVLKRDEYKCQVCGYKGKDLRVHHLNGYDWDIENRLNTANAITLCKTCHHNFHSIYGSGNNTKEQFEEWINKTIEINNCDDIIISAGKQVYCFEDDKVFNTPKECAEFYNLNKESLYHCCNHRSRYCGKDHKHFFYLEEYKTLTKEQIDNYINAPDNGHSKKVYLLNTGEIFNSCAEACRKYNIHPSSLSRHCKSTKGTAGNLTWCFYEDYINKTDIYLFKQESLNKEGVNKNG